MNQMLLICNAQKNIEISIIHSNRLGDIQDFNFYWDLFLQPFSISVIISTLSLMS